MIWDPACGDSTGSNRIGKYQARVSPRPAWGRGEKGRCNVVCQERLCMIGLMVYVLFTCGECGFSSFGHWF